MTGTEIKALLADMTLKEKIGQLTQLDASCFNDEGPVTGAETELGIAAEDFPYAGSILGVVGAEQVEKLQKMCMEKQPHHIPVLFMADIINGYKTIFPIPLALGCSFDEEAAKRGGRCYGQGVCSGRFACDICTNGRPGAGCQMGKSYGIYRRRSLSECTDGSCYGKRDSGRFSRL